MANGSLQETLTTEAANLVERSRLGDQNATAMIQSVASAASEGKARAVAAFNAIRDYIAGNPHVAVVHGDSPNGSREYQQARVALANGPRISVGAVLAAGSSFAGEPLAYKAFTFGYAHFGMPGSLGALTQKLPQYMHQIRAGAAMAYARALQKLRMPGSKISDFSANIGWELGE